jgi:hypothetical protein
LVLEELALPSTTKVIMVILQFFQQLLLLVEAAAEQIQLPTVKLVGAGVVEVIREVLEQEVPERLIKVMLAVTIELLGHILLEEAEVRVLLAVRERPLIQQEAVEMELHLA